MSIGYTSAINGSTGSFNLFVRAPKNSGGAIKGYMPPTINKVDKDYENFEQIRVILKEAWNTRYQAQLRRSNLKTSITTPFRAVNNAGDILSRLNYCVVIDCDIEYSMHSSKYNEFVRNRDIFCQLAELLEASIHE